MATPSQKFGAIRARNFLSTKGLLRMADKKLFEFAIIKQERRDRQTGDVIDEAEILEQPQVVLVKDEAEAQIVAARSIPDEAMGDLERVTLVVRPF
jgi:hypothetical protein